MKGIKKYIALVGVISEMVIFLLFALVIKLDLDMATNKIIVGSVIPILFILMLAGVAMCALDIKERVSIKNRKEWMFNLLLFSLIVFPYYYFNYGLKDVEKLDADDCE